jgi:hypothetical protein
VLFRPSPEHNLRAAAFRGNFCVRGPIPSATFTIRWHG